MKEPHRNARGTGGAIRSFPSLFDIFLCLSLLINIFSRTHEINIFFVFYSIFLWCLSMGRTAERGYKNKPLMMLMLWGLASLFIHSYIINQESITFRYLNFYLLSEGFLYILAGGVFFITVVRYYKNAKFLLVLSAMPWVVESIVINRVRFSAIFALSISCLIYLIYKKRYSISLSVIGLLIAVASPFRDRIISCFSTRPLIWNKLVSMIYAHPVVGTGFDKGLNPVNMVYIKEQCTHWVFRHGDILSLTAYLGIPALILSIWCLLSVLKVVRGIYLIPVGAVIILMNFQMTMFEPAKAISCLLLLGISVAESLKMEGCNEKSNMVTFNCSLCM